MGLDIDKILQVPREEIEQNDLERLKELGIISENIYLFDTLERPKKQYWVKKCEYDGQSFFIFNYFFFSSDPGLKNHIDLEKYLQSNEPNIILQNCLIGNQKDIKNLNKIKQAIIAINSEFPNISSCEFENEVFLRNISNNSTFGVCEFTKEVYVDGYAYFQACTFNGDFISANAINGDFIPEKNAKQDISFASSIFNKSFELVTKNELEGLKFEAAHFKQKFTMDIGKFSVIDFSSAEFDCELNLHTKQFDGINIDFTKAMFKQKVSFYGSIINCRMLFKEACFEDDLIFTKAKFNDLVNLSKVVFKKEVHFHGTKFNKAIISETNFENKVDFSNAIFKEKAHFRNAIFTKDVKLNNILFKNNAYFKNTLFKDFVNFSETNFEKNANFYSANFEKPVNFSSIIFNGALNFVNAKTDFTYDELKKFIEDTSTNNISATNDFRDGFRLMKHALNNKGNALDASLFHRLELYCKELELEFTLENTKAKDSKNDKK